MLAVVSRLSGVTTSVVMLRVVAPTEKKVEEKFGEIFFLIKNGRGNGKKIGGAR